MDRNTRKTVDPDRDALIRTLDPAEIARELGPDATQQEINAYLLLAAWKIVERADRKPRP